MAKLEGVKTLDMVNGEITKVEYDGAVYEKVDDEVQDGDLVSFNKDARYSGDGLLAFKKYVIYGPVYKKSISNEKYRCAVGSIIFNRAGEPNVFRKVSEPARQTIEQVNEKVDALAERVSVLEQSDTLEKDGEQSKESTETSITFEGEEYTLVDRKAQPGDVVYVTEDAGSTEAIPNEEYYRVNVDGEIGASRDWTHPVYRDGHFNRTADTVKVYEPIAESTPEFKEGDRVKAITNGQFNDVKAGEVGEITEIMYYDGYGIRVDTDDDYDYFRPQDLEVVSESVAKLAKYGRKPGEFKKGDIAKGYGIHREHTVIGEVVDVSDKLLGVKDGKGYTAIENFELIAPVESRVDLVE